MSSANTVVGTPSIMFSSSASAIKGNAGNSPSRSTRVYWPVGVYECTNRAPSKGPPAIVVTTPLGGRALAHSIVRVKPVWGVEGDVSTRTGAGLERQSNVRRRIHGIELVVASDNSGHVS